eukprot:scaffold47729_cov57-Phaeocystis_antarctica.AAC.1
MTRRRYLSTWLQRRVAGDGPLAAVWRIRLYTLTSPPEKISKVKNIARRDMDRRTLECTTPIQKPRAYGTRSHTATAPIHTLIFFSYFTCV